MSVDGWRVLGRLVDASNATFLVEDEGGRRFVHKPVAGEQPLWDFPDGTLGRREVAAHMLSEQLGLDVVPRTSWVEGPFGEGSLQEFVDGTLSSTVNLLRPEELDEGWLPVASFVDEHGAPLVLAHRDDERLRRIALFDVLANNADRKAGHLIEAADGRLLGVDHGLTLHRLDKLRTVAWGFRGMPLSDDELAVVRAAAGIVSPLSPGLADAEWEAVVARALRLLREGVFPSPGDGWPSIPWPPF